MASGRNGILLDKGSELVRSVAGGHDAQQLTVEAENQRAFGVTQPDRVLSQRLEDRLEVEGGSPDDLQQLAGCRLLLQRHSQLTVAGFQLLEQPHILYGDDRLVGKCLEQ